MSEQSQLKGYPDSFEAKVIGDNAGAKQRKSLGKKSITLRTSMTKEQLYLSFKNEKLFYNERPLKIEVQFKEGEAIEIKDMNCYQMLQQLRGATGAYLVAEYYKDMD